MKFPDCRDSMPARSPFHGVWNALRLEVCAIALAILALQVWSLL